jgi:DNA-binding transcriptional regulator GbsR (MarR family)
MADKHEHTTREFIEAMAAVAEQNWGMSRMAGRIWAVLLATEKTELSAEELMQLLGASRGSVSTVVRTLERVGIVQRVVKSGDRKHYYRVPPATALMELELAGVDNYRRLMRRGLDAVSGIHPVAETRLREYHDLMAFFQSEYAELLRRWKERPVKRETQ